MWGCGAAFVAICAQAGREHGRGCVGRVCHVGGRLDVIGIWNKVAFSLDLWRVDRRVNDKTCKVCFGLRSCCKRDVI